MVRSNVADILLKWQPSDDVELQLAEHQFTNSWRPGQEKEWRVGCA